MLNLYQKHPNRQTLSEDFSWDYFLLVILLSLNGFYLGFQCADHLQVALLNGLFQSKSLGRRLEGATALLSTRSQSVFFCSKSSHLYVDLGVMS